MSRRKIPQITNDAAIDAFIAKMVKNKKFMSHKRQNLEIGDSVRLKHPIDKRYVNGVVETIDGWNVYVKMKYKGILVHRYPNELIKINCL